MPAKNAQKLKGVWGPNQTNTCHKAQKQTA